MITSYSEEPAQGRRASDTLAHPELSLGCFLHSRCSCQRCPSPALSRGRDSISNKNNLSYYDD